MNASNKNVPQDIDRRTFLFAVRVAKMVLQLPSNVVAWKIGGQVTDSAMSVNSNVVQARAGVSKKDFINHYRIALKEAEETRRWLEMLIEVGLIPLKRTAPLVQENTEIIKILVSIINTARK